jgi:hypothetical protein
MYPAGRECLRMPTRREYTHIIRQDRHNRMYDLHPHSCQIIGQGYDMRVSRGAQVFLQFQATDAQLFPMCKRCLNLPHLENQGHAWSTGAPRSTAAVIGPPILF